MASWSISRAATRGVSRSFHTSRVARDAHHSAADSAHVYPGESFTTPIWRNTFLFVVAGVGLYKLNETVGKEENSDDQSSWLTRYLAYNHTPATVWEERQEKHLKFARERAAQRLFFQDAERPPLHRMRYPAALQQASGARVPVGSAVNVEESQ